MLALAKNHFHHSRRDIQVTKKLRKAKFTVYLAKCANSNKIYALKVFPFENDGLAIDYVNEAAFSALDHHNVIKMVECVDERESVHHGKHDKISYILMELAPYGDFYDLFMVHNIVFDEQLARSYFHQLIEGLEYLHKHGVAHLDLKPDNLLLGEDFKLKICDFDLSYMDGDEHINSCGTKYYRSPELVIEACHNPIAADVFSAGILLFIFKCSGKLPQTEGADYNGVNLYTLMQNDNEKFWATHHDIMEQGEEFFTEEFKELFNGMTHAQPDERWSLAKVKGSKWYQGTSYSEQEIQDIMKVHYEDKENHAKEDNEEDITKHNKEN